MCENLQSIDIPESVTQIGSMAFTGCSSLTSIVIPQGVTEIGESAFDSYGLTTVVVKRMEPVPISEWTFSNYDNATLYVPKGSRDAYKEAENWKLFSRIVELSGVRGDVNNDNITNVADVTVLVSHILGMHPNDFIVANADINGDKQLSVVDVTTLVNIILGIE